MIPHEFNVFFCSGSVLGIEVDHEMGDLDNVGGRGSSGGKTSSHVCKCYLNLLSEGRWDDFGVRVDADLTCDGDESTGGRDGYHCDVRICWPWRVNGGWVDELSRHDDGRIRLFGQLELNSAGSWEGIESDPGNIDTYTMLNTDYSITSSLIHGEQRHGTFCGCSHAAERKYDIPYPRLHSG